MLPLPLPLPLLRGGLAAAFLPPLSRVAGVWAGCDRVHVKKIPCGR